MEKLLIVGCKRAMDDVCIGCSRCLVAFNRREGTFEIYQDQEVELLGLLNCGDCPGVAIVTRLAQVKLWNAPMGEQVTKIHLAPCVVEHCPHARDILRKMRATAGIPVIEGAHPYMPQNIFATG